MNARTPKYNISADSMKKRLRFNRKYFVVAVVIFFIEILIAVFVHDRFIRPYVGDVLVVILIYCFVKSFLDLPVLPTALAVLLFSFAIETLQYYEIVNRLGLQDSTIASTVIGNSFAWIDVLAYIIGIILVLCFEFGRGKRMLKANTNTG